MDISETATTLPTPSRGKVVAALIAVYFIWGSTYLGLVFGLEGFPPFLLNGIRFLIAGGIMFTILKAQRCHNAHCLANGATWSPWASPCSSGA